MGWCVTEELHCIQNICVLIILSNKNSSLRGDVRSGYRSMGYGVKGLQSPKVETEQIFRADYWKSQQFVQSPQWRIYSLPLDPSCRPVITQYTACPPREKSWLRRWVSSSIFSENKDGWRGQPRF